MTNCIFTLGYEGLSLQKFIEQLQAAGVQTVVDVRANPLSRKPGFSKRAFAAALNAAGITYVHSSALGCPKSVRDGYKRDGDWAAYTRHFFAHLKNQSEAVAQLARSAAQARTCLVCFEADFNRCHRTFVGQAAGKINGMTLSHLMKRTEIPDEAVRSAA
jgi:uncharacterized protein (DUF488 family)